MNRIIIIEQKKAEQVLSELCKKFNIAYGDESNGGFGAALAHIFDDFYEVAAGEVTYFGSEDK